MTRIRARKRHIVRQQGQAMVEALLLLPLMAVTIWAVAGIGDLQFLAQQMSQASRKAVMSGALGQPLAPSWARASTVLTKQGKTLQGVATPRLSALQDEWFGAGLQLLSVQAQAAPLRVDAVFAPSIARQTRVAIGAGHAYGDADARRRIANAPTAWRQVERGSLTQARRVGALVRRMDGAWGRPSVSTDWLSAWEDVVPSDRLGRRGGKSR